MPEAMIVSTEPIPDLNDIFNNIAARALAKGGVTDATWINVVAGEYRKAFAELGLTVPPGGIVEVTTAEPNPELPPPVTPISTMGPVSRALMFMAVFEQPDSPIWVTDVRALDVTSGALRTLVSGTQWAMGVEWRMPRTRTGIVEFARITALYLPKDPANPAAGEYRSLTPPWLAGYRPLSRALHQAVDGWIAARGNADIRRCGPWWPKATGVQAVD